MTSRQRGTSPPGTAGPDWLRLVPLVLLIFLGLAGLRGTVTAPRWNGPLHQDGPAIALLLEVVLAVLLAITLRRGRTGSQQAVARKLRGLLLLALGAGMVAVAVTALVGLHLHVFSRGPVKLPPQPSVSLHTPRVPRRAPGGGVYLPLQATLYALLVVALLAGLVLSLWWARRLRRPAGRARADGFIAEDPEQLREAVESGRSALRTFDDARAAIIACYVAMENSLAERGAAREVAGTPDELLARATETGLVRGTAAARLTALFYEARFSSHPLDRTQRDAAERALDELAAALPHAETAGGAGKTGGAGG